MRPRLLSLIIAIVAGACLTAASGTVRADNAPTAVLVIDGSGSMWGRLPPDGRAKIDIVREKLATILQSPSPAKVGLVSFGHRRRGDCTDVELIAPPDAARDTLLGPLAQLNPRGPGPVTAAIKAAVGAVGTARPAQIIVVGDNADNCQPDSCAVAADIAKTSPGITIQVIGIGITPAERPRFACFADATGGRYYDMTDSTGLLAALDETSRLAMLSPGAAPSTAAAKPSAPPVPAGASIRVSAALKEGGALLAVPLRWRMFKSGDNTVLGESSGVGITAKLPAGRYDVEAQLGSVTARQQIDIADGDAQSIIVPLNAAHLSARAGTVKGSEPSASAVLSVASGDTPVGIGRNGVIDLYLPPAAYTVTVVDKSTRAAQSVTLSAGDNTALDIPLGTGRLDLTSTGPGTVGTIDDVLYTIYEDDPESPDGRREVARSRAAAASFTLPAGTYYVSARSGAADVRQRIAIGVGEVVKQTMALAVAPLKVSTVIAGAPARPEHGVIYRVDRLDGGHERVARAPGPELALNLPAGRYQVSATVPAYHLSVAQDVTLEAGKPAVASLDIPSGVVKFKPPPNEIATNGDIYWEVVDVTGAPVWRATGLEANTLLAPGHYTVRIEARGKHKEAAFDVRAGQTQDIEIGPG